MIPETRYARTADGVHIAYQVVGTGPVDLVYVPGWVSNIELMWEELRSARFLERLARFCRLILFDKRGTGLSDRVPEDHLPTMEQRMDDVRTVMDAAGSKRAALLGNSEGCGMCCLFAATYPRRTIDLVLFGAFAKRLWSADYPWAPTPERRYAWIDSIEEWWGTEGDIRELAPTAAEDPMFRQWFTAYFRRSASPSAAVALARMNTQIDVRSVLPTIRVPTLVMHHTKDRDASVEEARWIASEIPEARFVELPGNDHLVWTGDQEPILAEIEEFLTGVRPVPEPDRVLATLLFTDIVSSTERAHELGDSAWRDLLERHHILVRSVLERFHGREVDTAGDGFLATFDGPARAVRCGLALVEAVRSLGLKIRAGCHTGEVELAGDGVRGIAVHIGARVAALAGPSEVLVSSTVKDLVAGSGLGFEDRGEHELKGVPDRWRIYAVVNEP